MKCSQCQQLDTKVIESRDVAEGAAIRRRRACLHCGFRFTTYERIERPQLIVIKNDGTQQLFSREKLLEGLYRACDKTPVSRVELDNLVSDVEHELHNRNETEFSTNTIGQIVMDKLAPLNEVAYVRFASVYRRFKDIAGFERELSQIRGQKPDSRQKK